MICSICGKEHKDSACPPPAPPIAYGWVCPKCGGVYAIWVDRCPVCAPQQWIQSYPNTTGGYYGTR